MKNYTIAESYTLPSKGEIYDEMVAPNIKLRSMTTEEEMKRLAKSDYPFRNMCEIIDDCMIESPGISSYDMCLGDYQFLLHKLRVVTYGKDYKVVNTCPYCGCNTEDVVDLDTLDIVEYDPKIKELLEFDLPKTGKHIKLKIQTPRMLDDVSERVREFKRKNQGSKVDLTIVYTIAGLIDTVDGKKPNVVGLEQWVRELPMADTNIILSYADKVNNAVGIDTNLTAVCDVCGLSHPTAFKMTPEFFRPALNIGW